MTPADITGCREAAEHSRRLAAKEVNPVEKHDLQHTADEWLRLAQTHSSSVTRRLPVDGARKIRERTNRLQTPLRRVFLSGGSPLGTNSALEE